MPKVGTRAEILAGWDDALAEIAEGTPPKQVADAHGWPWRTFLDISLEPERSAMYARARDAGWHALADECLTVSDDGRRDYKPDPEDPSRMIVDHDHIARARLRVDTRRWLLSKMLPKVFGDLQKHQLVGNDGQDREILLPFSLMLPTDKRRDEPGKP